MAWYQKFENQDKVFIEQNIFDRRELESYDAVYETNGEKRTSVLYYSETKNKDRFYALGLLESLNTDVSIVIASDLSEIFKYKTAKTRRKYIFEIIRNNEKKLSNKPVVQ